jgi:hypothetical protein
MQTPIIVAEVGRMCADKPRTARSAVSCPAINRQSSVGSDGVNLMREAL